MEYIDEQKIKEKLLGFTQESVEKFLKNNLSLEFYSFAYDCNAEYAEVNLCFNTEGDFRKTLIRYQTGEFSRYYQTESEIYNLKYNTGNWDYQCFETINVLTEKELNNILEQMPDDEYKTWLAFSEDLMKIFCKCLIDFTQTEIYNNIPKTKDFMAFCIDHDEDIEDALKRMEHVRNTSN